ncbi:open rectifier potassium channel protein 1-like [Clytia hemisphaerica]|uniref:Uncharacterized protein n=1 Tax=Clytia hemisphaerica TaxID=252671 RepID=A0A7M5XAY0_9CNID
MKFHIESTKKIFGIDADRILFCPKKSLAAAKLKLFKQLKYSAISFVIVFCFLMLGALLFYYIEHCYTPTPRRIERHEKAYQDLCARVALLQTNLSLINNTSQSNNYKNELADYAIELCTNAKPKDYTRRCEMAISTLAEWFDYTCSVTFTIGFGRIVPYSRIGKGLTILYAFPTIALGMSLYLSAGHVVTAFTEACVLLFYNNMLNRRLEKKTFSVHVMVVQTFFTFLLWVAFSFVCMYSSYQTVTEYSDAFYIAFLTISTVGFGDFSYSSEKAFRTHFLVWTTHAVLFTISTGAIAYLMSSVNELIANGNIKIPKWCMRSARKSSVVPAEVLTKVKSSFRNLNKKKEQSASKITEISANNPKQIFLSPSTAINSVRTKKNQVKPKIKKLKVRRIKNQICQGQKNQTRTQKTIRPIQQLLIKTLRRGQSIQL